MARRDRRREQRNHKTNKTTGNGDVLETIDKMRSHIKQEKKIVTEGQPTSPLVFLIVGGIISVIILGGFAIVMTTPSSRPPNNIGEEIEQGTQAVYDLSGNTVYLSDYKGKSLIIEWFAISCSFCKQQYPILKDFQNQHPLVEILLISTSPSDTADRLVQYRADNDIPWKITRDVDKINSDFGVSGIPQLDYINSNGQWVKTNVGVTSIETLNSWIN